jgi:hypothetical protein
MSVLHKFAVGRVLMALAVGCWIPVILACQPLSFSRLSYESIALLPWCVLTTIGILHQRSFSYCSPIAAVYHAVVTWCAPPSPLVAVVAPPLMITSCRCALSNPLAIVAPQRATPAVIAPPRQDHLYQPCATSLETSNTRNFRTTAGLLRSTDKILCTVAHSLSSGVQWSVAEHLRGLGSVIFWAYILICRYRNPILET